MGIGFWGIFGFSLVQGGGGLGVQASGYERGFRLLWLRVRGFGCYDPEFRS